MRTGFRQPATTPPGADRGRAPRPIALAARSVVAPLAAALLAGTAAAADTADTTAAAQEPALHVGGYLRGWTSVNLQDQPETPANDRGRVSMARASLLLDADWQAAPGLKLKGIARFDGELHTPYLKSLEEGPDAKAAGSTAAVFRTAGGGNIGGLMKQYRQAALREAWAEWEPNSRVKVKFGKQQIVWGETDFFRAMDVVHGFDFRWRSFLEVENEELRKPLVMLRALVQVPEAKGALDVFVRPGWDEVDQIGNTYDLAGGRWASQPTRGASFLYATQYNYRSAGADARDLTGGFKWSGTAGDLNYSLAYLRTFNNDPVNNPCPETLAALYGGAAIPAGQASSYTTFKQRPVACGFSGPGPYGNPLQFGDWIFPTTDVVGGTASMYSAAADAVFSTEVVFQRNRSFNVGIDGGKFGPNITPGAFGIVQKNTLTTMFRADKQLDLSALLGTSRPSFASVQFFNTRILGYDAQDEIVQLAYWNRRRNRDSAMLTGILALNYANDRINPALAAGWDVSYGGGFVIPSVEWVLGDQWRLKAELDLFYDAGNTKQRYLNPTTGQLEEQGRGAGLFGYFSKANQFVVRVTRQF